MRQLFLERGTLAIKEVCEPVLDDYSVLVLVNYSFLSSGTGLAKIIDENQNLFFKDVPHKVKKVVELVTQRGFDYTTSLIKDKLSSRVLTLGNSCSGIVISVGSKVRQFRVGDLVACVGPGMANHAEVVCVPEKLVVRIKNKNTLKAASLTGIGSMALQSVRRADIQLGESVCVFGLEILGQLIAKLCKLSGCKIFGVDSNDAYLKYSQISGLNSYNLLKDDIQNSIGLATGFHGVDCVIITPEFAKEEVIQLALEVTRKKGRIVIAGNADITLKKNLAYQKEIDIHFSTSYGPGRYDPVYEYMGHDYPYSYVRWTENRNMEVFIDLLENNQLNLESLITSEFSLDQLSNAIDELHNEKNLGVFLNYIKDKKTSADLSSVSLNKSQNNLFIPAFKDSLRVGIYGANRYDRINLLPVIAKFNDINVNSIVDKEVSRSLNATNLFKGARALSGDAKLFYDDDSNVVIISPSAQTNVDEVITILQKGKAVFMTKPLAVDFDDLDKMKAFFKEKPNVPFCVGYHRSYSPFVQKIKKALSKRTSPLMMHYRINIGNVSREELLYSQWKPGRIIAQASHIFDLFCYLTEAKPISVSVESIGNNDYQAFPTENFSAQISFADGSVCSLMFTSLGHKDLESEHMEIFFDSKTIIMDDFLTLRGYGLTGFDEKVRIPDKGFEQLAHAFFIALKQEDLSLPINLDRITTIAQITLTVDNLVCKGGGEKSLLA